MFTRWESALLAAFVTLAGCAQSNAPVDVGTACGDVDGGCQDASADATNDACVPFHMLGCPCHSDQDCTSNDPFPEFCSYSVSGCDVTPICMPQRGMVMSATLCGCDGSTFTAGDVYTDGIRHPWVHSMACDSADSFAPCRSDADCSDGQGCFWLDPGCDESVLGACMVRRGCVGGSYPNGLARCLCSGIWSNVETCDGPTERWTWAGVCREP